MDGVFRRTVKKHPQLPWCSGSESKRLGRPLFSRAQLEEFQNGVYSQMYRHLGAHPAEEGGVTGTRFAVWAPNAEAVSVLCDSNSWTPGSNALYGSDSGVWSGFVAGMKSGDAYKYSIRARTGEMLEKCDPVAFYAEIPPKTASIVFDLDGYEWDDTEWMTRRGQTNWFEQPLAIYEVHLPSWKRPDDGRKYFSYRELAHQLVDYCHEMGYTHLQLLPVTEHPFDGSWGYQTTGYFAPTSRFGDPHEFMYFVDHCHRNGIGVFIDWVPAHFPTDGHALGRFDGTCLYEHEDPRKGAHPDWNTLIFNYGRHEVTDFLLSSARFWLDKYHVDGLRVDAVASMLYLDYSRKDGEWIPNEHGGRENLEAIEFLKEMNTQIHGQFDGVLTIAEESTAWGGVSHPVYSGGLGFSMKWDMGWMNDTLHYMRRDPIYRQHHQGELSFRMVYAFTENFVLPLSHDEVVHGKKSLISQMPGDHWQQFANLRMLYGYQYSMPGKKLLFMGGEVGQWEEWNHDEQIDWGLHGSHFHDGLRQFIGDLNRVYKEQPELHQVDFDAQGFRWIQCDDAANCVFAFCRYSIEQKSHLVIVLNFTPVPRDAYRIGVPGKGDYVEILNSDSSLYGGGNVGNDGVVKLTTVKSHGFDQSVELRLPPMGMLILRPE